MSLPNWTCSSPECSDVFQRAARRVRNAARNYCSVRCRSRHRSLLLLPHTARDDIRERYEKGEHTGALAGEYEVSPTTIKTVLREFGIEPDRTRAGAASWAPRLDTPPDEGDLHTGFRWCLDCQQRKQMDDFYWRSSKTTRNRRCKPCHGKYQRSRANLKANRRKHLYGLPNDEFERLLGEQDGRCKICSDEIEPEQRTLHVDHCHFDKQVRGLLCNRCNTGLGHFRDDPDLLSAAAAYLHGSGHWHPDMEDPWPVHRYSPESA